MKIRLYDSGKKYEGFVDRYTLYFKYPKWLQKSEGANGICLGCSPNVNNTGINKCTYFEHPNGCTINSDAFHLGKRIKLETMPESFRICAERLEKAFNDALKHNNAEYWDKWLNA